MKAIALLVHEAKVTDDTGAEVDVAALEGELSGPGTGLAATSPVEEAREASYGTDFGDESVMIDVPFVPREWLIRTPAVSSGRPAAQAARRPSAQVQGLWEGDYP